MEERKFHPYIVPTRHKIIALDALLFLANKDMAVK
jgi:hypothetical protein